MTVKGRRRVRQTVATIAKMAAEDGIVETAAKLGIGRDKVQARLRGHTVPVIPGKRTEHEAKVDEVLMMMAQGEWHVGTSAREMATKWGVSLHSAQMVAAEASRAVRRAVNEQMDGYASTLLQRIERQAFIDGDYAAAVKALELHLKAFGRLVDKQEIKHDHYANLSDAQLVEAVRVELKQLEERAPEGTNE